MVRVKSNQRTDKKMIRVLKRQDMQPSSDIQRNEQTISSQKRNSSSQESSSEAVTQEEVESKSEQEEEGSEITQTESEDESGQSEEESSSSQENSKTVKTGKGKNKDNAIQIDSQSVPSPKKPAINPVNNTKIANCKIQYVTNPQQKRKQFLPQDHSSSESLQLQKNIQQQGSPMIPERREKSVQKNGLINGHKIQKFQQSNEGSFIQELYQKDESQKLGSPKQQSPEVPPSNIALQVSLTTQKISQTINPEHNNINEMSKYMQIKKQKDEKINLTHSLEQYQSVLVLSSDEDDHKIDNYQYNKELYLDLLQFFERQNDLKMKQREHLRRMNCEPEKKIQTNKKANFTPIIKIDRPSNPEQKMKDDMVVKLTIPKINLKSLKQRKRFNIKRLVAKAFIRKGHGIQNLRHQIEQTPYPIQFDQNRYSSILNNVMTETFRRIENFVEQYCGMRLYKIEMRPIIKFLLKFSDESNSTLTRFMRLIYKVDCEQTLVFKKQDVRNFYELIATSYYEKQGKCLPGNEKFKPIGSSQGIKEEQLSFETQCQILAFYIETKSVAGVKERLFALYGQDILDGCRTLKNLLHKLWRQSVRKLKEVASEMRQLFDQLGFLSNLSGERIKKLLVSPEAVEARVALCQFFIEENMGVSDVKQLIGILEVSIYRMQKKNQHYNFDF